MGSHNQQERRHSPLFCASDDSPSDESVVSMSPFWGLGRLMSQMSQWFLFFGTVLYFEELQIGMNRHCTSTTCVQSNFLDGEEKKERMNRLSSLN
jgi:hypothetical protein